MTFYYTDKEAHSDLQAHLIKFGVLAVSCKTYMGLNERAVRPMLSQSGEMPMLSEAMEKAIQALPEQATETTSHCGGMPLFYTEQPDVSEI